MNKLHLGCGNKNIDGFINVDIRPLPQVDLVDNISELNNVENDSVDLIYACHVLEHFGRHEYMLVLKRWYEVIKKGGTLRIAVPDFGEVVNYYNKNQDMTNLMGFLYRTFLISLHH